MNNTAKVLLCSAVSAAAGSICTYIIMKSRFQKMADEEIESVKEAYKQANESDFLPDENEENETIQPDESVSDTISATFTSDAITYSDIVDRYKTPVVENDENISINPYTIPPEEYGTEDYRLVQMTYYEDCVLVEDAGERIMSDGEIKIMIGDALTTFGEYEEDSVFVRNDQLKTDYEIVRDAMKYSDIQYYDENE